MMRVTMLVLCFFMTFMNNGYAGEMYNCVDSNGNSIITDIPQDGMKCELKESSSEASAGTLSGIWIFDPKGTEEYIKASPEYRGRRKTGEHFGIAGHLLCAFLYEFKGDTVIMKKLTSDKKTGEFKLLSRNGTEIQYILNEDEQQTNNSKKEILNVSVLNNKNIKIYYSRQKEFDFLLWKRMTDPNNEIRNFIGQPLKQAFKTIGEVLFAETK